MRYILFLLAVAFVGSVQADLKVATLHPLMTDLAQNVGGDRVEVVSLLRVGGDPHTFSPSPGDLARIAGSRLVLASGKGLEPYLDRVRASVQPGQEIFEVGKRIPSLKVEVGEVFVCCPDHHHGAIDPHWWHSISNMQRAARYLGDEFARVDAENASFYKSNARAYSTRLDKLKSWATAQLAAIPKSRRKLVTAHAAFGYFCREFGFRSLPVQGLDRTSDPSPAYLAETIQILRKEKIAAVFPEQLANPKVLESMVRETGVKTGPALIADGTAQGAEATFEGMIRYNVNAIVSALR